MYAYIRGKKSSMLDVSQEKAREEENMRGILPVLSKQIWSQ